MHVLAFLVSVLEKMNAKTLQRKKTHRYDLSASAGLLWLWRWET